MRAITVQLNGPTTTHARAGIKSLARSLSLSLSLSSVSLHLSTEQVTRKIMNQEKAHGRSKQRGLHHDGSPILSPSPPPRSQIRVAPARSHERQGEGEKRRRRERDRETEREKDGLRN